MRNKLIITAMLLLSFLAVGWANQAPRTWEYKVVTGKCNNEKTLNTLGAEGWELSTYSTWALSTGAIDTCVFKRAK